MSVHGHRCGNRTALARHRLAITLGITAAICVAETVGGFISGSLALLSDAGHMLTDILSLLLSLFALLLSTRRADSKRTYGYYRLEIIAAFLNGILLFSLSAGLLYSAWLRLQHPREIEGGVMMLFALVGLAGNVLGAVLLMGFRDNINLRAAFLHVMSDGISSAGVLLGSLVIYKWRLYWIDVALGVLIAALIIYSSLRVLREATSILMESIPHGLELTRVREMLLRIPGIRSVHDLHVWSISTDMPALSAHIVVDDAEQADSHRLLEEIHTKLDDEFRLSHTTIQIETESFRKCCASDH
ncbi:MAG: cation diffusion facilitator family transporter [Acidobacteriota bacterium]